MDSEDVELSFGLSFTHCVFCDVIVVYDLSELVLCLNCFSYDIYVVGLKWVQFV